MRLSESDRAMQSGDMGPGTALAMEIVLKLAETADAPDLVDIKSAHVDGCLYHGEAGIDFAERLLEGGACAVVPTTLNVSSLDLLHPDLYKGDAKTAERARRLMDLHVDLGCQPTWTCAPYQLAARPAFGDQIAWGESNAIVFANSVLGARTNRYGDFADLACAVTGRAPNSGLHTDAGRHATIAFHVEFGDMTEIPDVYFPLIGHVVGERTGEGVPLITGLPESVSEDDLKAIGAAAASSGSVAMFHVEGVTPEAQTFSEATGGRDVPIQTLSLTDLAGARRSLGAVEGMIAAVSVGTPHMSRAEIVELSAKAAGKRSVVPFYVNTSRSVLDELDKSTIEGLERFGVTFVTDTCTYITPIIGEVGGAIMTNSGKWAYYAPANLGVDVVLGGLGECVDSSVDGRVTLSSGSPI